MLSNPGLPVSDPCCFQWRAITGTAPRYYPLAALLLAAPSAAAFSLPLQSTASTPPHCGPKGPSKVAPRIWSVEIYIGVIQLLRSGVVDAIRRRRTAPTFGFAAGTFLFATVFCGLYKWMEVNGCDWERVGTGRPGPLRAIGVNEGE